MQDHYAELGVTRTAEEQAIRRAYFERARRHHPDVAPGGDPEAMRRLNAAFAVLGNAERRRQYDAATTSTARSTEHTTRNHREEREMNDMVYQAEERGGEAMTLPDAPAVPRSFQQLGIFVNDGSGSMASPTITGMAKRACVGIAVGDTLGRFQASSKKANFSFAAVDFDDQAAPRLGITAATDADPNQDYTPNAPGSGGTYIGAGLEKAEQIAADFLSGQSDVPKSVIIVVLSDGMDGDAGRTLEIARRLKQRNNVTLCACFLAGKDGSNAQAVQHLQAIATNPAANYRTVYDADTIRGFFISSVSAGTKL